MHLVHARTFDIGTMPERHATVPSRAPAMAPREGRYGEQRRPNLAALAAIAALHVAALAALVTLDVIPAAKPHYSELKVVDIAEAPPPPLAQAPPPPDRPQPRQPATTPIVAPPAIVAVAVAASPVVTAPTPAPAAEPVAAAPATPAAVIVAPITAPNGSAKSLNNPAPRYPTDSRRRREEGVVRLRVVITVEGRVKEIAVARSSGFERLDEAALDAVRRWRFLPGLQGGSPIEAIGFLSIPFQIRA